MGSSVVGRTKGGEMNKEITINGHFGLTQTGWSLPDLTEDQWESAGAALVKLDRARQWWLGDWWNSCKWGDGEEACKRIGVNYSNARVCGHVADTFQMLRRRNNLTFNHHREVCPIEDESIQDQLLDAASEHGWSIRTLRDLAKYFLHTGNLVFDVEELGDEVERELSDYDEKVVVGDRTDEWHEAIEIVEKLIFKYRDEGWKRILKDTVKQDIKVFWNMI